MIISNIYYLLRRNASHEDVVEKLKQLITIFDVLITTKDAIILALNSDFRDFEDALQSFSATLNGEIDLILTRNIKDFKSSKIAVMTPGNFVKTIKSAS